MLRAIFTMYFCFVLRKQQKTQALRCSKQGSQKAKASPQMSNATATNFIGGEGAFMASIAQNLLMEEVQFLCNIHNSWHLMKVQTA